MRDYNNSVAGRRFVADDDKAERRTRRFARRYPDDECAAVALGARWTPAVPGPPLSAGVAYSPLPYPGPPSLAVPTRSSSRSREIARDRAAPTPSANVAADGDAAEDADDSEGCDRSRRCHRLRRPPYRRSRRCHRYPVVNPPRLENKGVSLEDLRGKDTRHTEDSLTLARWRLSSLSAVSFKLKSTMRIKPSTRSLTTLPSLRKSDAQYFSVQSCLCSVKLQIMNRWLPFMIIEGNGAESAPFPFSGALLDLFIWHVKPTRAVRGRFNRSRGAEICVM